MTIRRQSLHILLALMITVSMVVLSGHNYSHARSDISSCELCVHHGNSNSAIAAEIATIFATPLAGPFIQSHHLTLQANTDFYRPPCRAPPRIT